MPFPSLRAFVDVLRKAGDLHTVATRVDPYLEIAEITDRVVKAGGPALLFTNVNGSTFPVLTNQFGTRRRMAMALEAADLDEAADRACGDSSTSPLRDRRYRKRSARWYGSHRLANAVPKTVRDASAHDVVEREPNLKQLPVLTTWPLDGGPFITLPLGDHARSGFGPAQRRHVSHAGVQRARNRNALAASQTRARARRRWGAKIPVAVAIGTDPVLTYAATAPLPPALDEFAFAGLLRGRPVELARRENGRPAQSPPTPSSCSKATSTTTTCASKDRSAIIPASTVWPTAIRRSTSPASRIAASPIYAATVVGKPPMEDAWLGKATERLFLPLLQLVLPEVVDMNLPVEGGFHNLAIVSIRKSYPGHAKKVMSALWGLGHMMMLTRVSIDRR